MKKSKGFLLPVLHAHLPYVRHPEYPSFLEEDWLFEAITETYIALIKMFERFVAERVNFRLTMSMSPPLISMLTDPLLQERYVNFLKGRIALASREVERTQGQDTFNSLARMYHETFETALDVFENKYQRNLLTAFKKFQDGERLDILTCGATHGYLPNMQNAPASVRAQIEVACSHYENHFGRPPRGIWLPECGYYSGLDEILKEYELEYFFLDAHGLLHGHPRPKFGVFAPVYCPSGVAAFGRDLESSKQVWSAEEGYPGDFAYRDFYRDIGFDLDLEYLKPYLHGDGLRTHTGIKYYRITGKTQHKEVYDLALARVRASEHAANFIFNREQQVAYLYQRMDRAPLIVSPYDAELFGHWWYEGPLFLEAVIRHVAHHSRMLELITAPEYLQIYSSNQVLKPSFSSWGHKGYSEVWLDGCNDWIYRHLHEADDRMRQLADQYPFADPEKERALKQAARELLLAQSSDWAFMMKMGTTVQYAERRVKEHLQNFLRICGQIENACVDSDWIAKLEQKNNIFPDIDWRIYASEPA